MSTTAIVPTGALTDYNFHMLVRDFIGRPVPMVQIENTAETIAVLAFTYTRGNGFPDGVPSAPIQRVIITATARLLANPSQIEHQIGSVVFRGAFDGWTPLERMILNAFRKVAR